LQIKSTPQLHTYNAYCFCTITVITVLLAHTHVHALSLCQVVSWARQQFLQEVSREKPDSSINLAKVCMLLALEEEAAGQLESEPSTSIR
jgi:hypothetical protein